MSSITLRQVEKRFGPDVVAVNGVSLTIQEGEFFTLLGPSGCGKTTTLRLIAGFERPNAGRILFGDEDVTDVPPHRRNTGMVFQSLALFPHMTVADNIAYGLRMRRMPPADVARRVEEMLALVRLSGLGHRRPDQLSGGQRQRVAFARALAIQPRIFLLDEPFAALDRKLREEMQIELRRLHRKLGITTVFVTHNQREAFTLSDRVAVMNRGRIEQVGTPEEIYNRPQTLFVADFVGPANPLPVRVLGREGQNVEVELVGEGSRMRLPAESVGDGGDSLTLVIRPEYVQLHPLDDSAGGGPSSPVENAGTLRARVDLVRFVGEVVEYHLVTEGGRELVASYQQRSGLRLSPGERVEVRLPPQRALLVRGQAA